MADNIVIEVIVDILFQYPGALMRWFLFRNKKTFKEILKQEFKNTMVTFAIIFVIVIFTILI